MSPSVYNDRCGLYMHYWHDFWLYLLVWKRILIPSVCTHMKFFTDKDSIYNNKILNSSVKTNMFAPKSTLTPFVFYIDRILTPLGLKCQKSLTPYICSDRNFTSSILQRILTVLIRTVTPSFCNKPLTGTFISICWYCMGLWLHLYQQLHRLAMLIIQISVSLQFTVKIIPYI